MGVVYQGYDPKIDRIVALKTIRKDRLAESRDVEDLVMRFQKELQATGKLVHPNIIVIYDTGEDEERAYIAMEYIEGDTLENLIQKGIRFPMEKIIDIIDQICEGLEYTHRQGIVHRDLKPSNIMLVQGEKVKIADFGISKAVGAASSPLTQAGILLGTPSYMSPEQIAGTEINGRSDLFSLGIILYQLLTGEKPFVGDTIPTLLYNIVNKDPTPPSQVDSSIPPLFDDVITKALAKNPDKRYRRPKDFVEDLMRAHRGEALMEAPGIEPTMTVAQTVAEKIYLNRKRYGLLAGFAVLLLALVLGGYYWMHRTPIPPKEEVGSVAPPEPLKKFGSIVVKSDPPDARVFLDGEELEVLTPAVIEEVTAGEKHEIEVAKKGFKPWVETVEPEDDKSVTIRAPLERLLTTIVIKSTPSGASVFLDGAEHNELTPTVIEEVSVGEKHEIRVEKRGFKSWTETVEPEDDKPLPIRPSLERLLTTIVIKSTPSGGSVFLDEAEHNELTPTVIEKVSVGEKHEIRVEKRGFKPWTRTVEPEPDKSLPIEATLERLMGTLIVRSTPPGASVFFDGKKMLGSTPIELHEVSVDDVHRIKVIKEGYEAGVQTITLRGDERKEVEVTLKPLLGEIRISSDPPGAKVYLNEKYMDRDTPTRLSRLSPGKYKLKLKKEGYKVWEDEVSLTGSEPLDLSKVTLQQAFGRLNLLVSPWADVYYLGRKLGTTPLANIRFQEGTHKLVLKNPLLKIEKGITVQIVADKVTKESVDITGEIKGTLKIRVIPWAHVYVDGEPMGMTPLKPLELPMGEHIVQVKNRELGEERFFRVVVKPNEVHSMDVNLLKKE
jgi:predicted Ser/Thr protein kinase